MTFFTLIAATSTKAAKTNASDLGIQNATSSPSYRPHYITEIPVLSDVIPEGTDSERLDQTANQSDPSPDLSEEPVYHYFVNETTNESSSDLPLETSIPEIDEMVSVPKKHLKTLFSAVMEGLNHQERTELLNSLQVQDPTDLVQTEEPILEEAVTTEKREVNRFKRFAKRHKVALSVGTSVLALYMLQRQFHNWRSRPSRKR